jgi:DNA repair protein RecN (Recombination protein N)
MILHLRISNFALLEEIEIDFAKGLSCLTGETGAGKSILIDAICRLLGARAAQEDVRAGASRSILEAIFDKERLPADVGNFLRDWNIDLEDEDLIVRREIQASGKSRASINNFSVTVLQLRQLGALLMDVFGQQEHQTLLDAESQRNLYDDSIGLQNRMETLSRIAGRIAALQTEWRELRDREQSRQRTIDMLQYQIREIEEVKPSEEEEEELLARRTILQNSGRIASICDALLQQILENDTNLVGLLDFTGREVNELARYKESLSSHGAKFTEWKEELTEVIREVDSLRRSLDFEEGALDTLELRLDVLQRLKKKYGPELIDVLRHLEQSKQELELNLHAEERGEELESAIRKAADEYEKLSAEIFSERERSRASFQRKVESELKHVAMGKCGFLVLLENEMPAESDALRREYPSCGRQSVSFQIEPNPGEGFRDLARTVSGGELSRLMLALKIVTRKQDGRRCFIFDEIDAGIGGREAYTIGERLKRLSAGSQVLAVTHLPQVAAFGDHHFHVSKKSTANRTTTVVEHLAEPERIRELARMLSGSVITETALKHARELRQQVEAGSV